MMPRVTPEKDKTKAKGKPLPYPARGPESDIFSVASTTGPPTVPPHLDFTKMRIDDPILPTDSVSNLNVPISPTAADPYRTHNGTLNRRHSEGPPTAVAPGTTTKNGQVVCDPVPVVLQPPLWLPKLTSHMLAFVSGMVFALLFTAGSKVAACAGALVAIVYAVAVHLQSYLFAPRVIAATSAEISGLARPDLRPRPDHRRSQSGSSVRSARTARRPVPPVVPAPVAEVPSERRHSIRRRSVRPSVDEIYSYRPYKAPVQVVPPYPTNSGGRKIFSGDALLMD